MAVLLNDGRGVGIETVLSSDKYRSHVDRLKAAGGLFCLVYVSLLSPDVAVERVARRVAKEGHGVPEDKIRARFIRSHENLPWFLSRADVAYIFDNSDSDAGQPPRLVARAVDGNLSQLDRKAIAPELRAALDVVDAASND